MVGRTRSTFLQDRPVTAPSAGPRIVALWNLAGLFRASDEKILNRDLCLGELPFELLYMVALLLCQIAFIAPTREPNTDTCIARLAK